MNKNRKYEYDVLYKESRDTQVRIVGGYYDEEQGDADQNWRNYESRILACTVLAGSEEEAILIAAEDEDVELGALYAIKRRIPCGTANAYPYVENSEDGMRYGLEMENLREETTECITFG